MSAVLRVEGLAAGYGPARILHGVDLSVGEGEAVAVLGRNGAGKTTLVRAIMGLARRQGGHVRVSGADATGLSPQQRCRLGLGWVPQERAVFGSLTVLENLAAVARPGPWPVSRALSLFPRLQERQNQPARQLSGGEQQMLALARALVLSPRILLLDEPLEGLAPVVAGEVARILADLRAREGMAMLLVEQKAATALALTDRAIVLERGRIVHREASAGLAADAATLARLLGLAQAPSAPDGAHAASDTPPRRGWT